MFQDVKQEPRDDYESDRQTFSKKFETNSERNVEKIRDTLKITIDNNPTKSSAETTRIKEEEIGNDYEHSTLSKVGFGERGLYYRNEEASSKNPREFHQETRDNPADCAKLFVEDHRVRRSSKHEECETIRQRRYKIQIHVKPIDSVVERTSRSSKGQLTENGRSSKRDEDRQKRKETDDRGTFPKKRKPTYSESSSDPDELPIDDASPSSSPFTPNSSWKPPSNKEIVITSNKLADDKNMIRHPIPSYCANWVSSRLAQFAAGTSCRLQLLDREVSKYRSIRVSGENRSEREKVQDRIDEFVISKQENDNKKHSFSNLNFVRILVPIPPRARVAVAKLIPSIKAECGIETTSNVCEEVPPYLLHGEPDAVRAAKKMLIDKIRTQKSVQVIIRNSLVGPLMGNGSKIAKRIQRETGIALYLYPVAEAVGADAERTVQLEGTDEQIDAAMAELRKIPDKKIRKDDPENVSVEVYLTSEKIGRLLGKNGVTIRNIEKESETKCQLERAKDHGDPAILRICGRPQMAEKARHLALIAVGELPLDAEFRVTGYDIPISKSEQKRIEENRERMKMEKREMVRRKYEHVLRNKPPPTDESGNGMRTIEQWKKFFRGQEDSTSADLIGQE
ncbi:unnamed protein product [Caenorhabditis sp. 36 PRJEB53466]|nr:unnamed protein product [Caenorhabditis sp. 36 PRJEB53466]